MEASKESNIVDFEGPDDPDNPFNWPKSHKVMSIVTIAFLTFLSPLASTMISPATEDVMKDFRFTNETLAAFVTTVFLLGYVAGPLVIAPLSELYGRSIIYQVCAILFFIFNVACAVANNVGSLIAFRFLAGIFGSCPLTIGAGTIADMIPREKHGAAMASWIIGPLFGPSVGPIVGGYLTPAKGWRWNFWVLSILTGFATLPTLFLRESYAHTILERKTKRLRKETGNSNLRSARDNGETAKDEFLFSIVRPLKMLFLAPIVFILSLYTAVIYSYLYLCFTTFPRIFEGQYIFSLGQSGLVYLGIGVGSILGVVLVGAISDRLTAALTKKSGGAPFPEYRLPTMIIGAFLVPAGLFWYGWTAENKAHWILPILGTAILGLGTICVFGAVSIYLVDAYTVHAASATAAATVFRSLFGALLPLVGNSMYDALGVGWGTSVLGFIAIGFIPMPFLLYAYGARIRESKLFQVEF